jgi:hypothetical protein
MKVEAPMPRFPTHPKHPERICWGCEKYCPATDLCCGNGNTRAMHPIEIFGDDWCDQIEEADADREAARSETSTGFAFGPSGPASP